MLIKILFDRLGSGRRIAGFLLSGSLLCACSSTPAPGLPDARELASQHPHQLQVVNDSKEVINAIKYKPCGANDTGFMTLTENLMPQQRVQFALFDTCIDLQAVNTFDQTLSEAKNMVLSRNAVWELH
jgi:hypothetical protein